MDHSSQPKALHIDSGYFVAGADLHNDRVVHCAHIIKYMKGWSKAKVLDYCAKKRWKVTEVT